jgi:CRISPR-associated protein Cas1
VDELPAPFELTVDDLRDAWPRVQENGGCAGVDGVTIDRFAQNLEKRLSRLFDAVQDGTYRALPLLRIVVEKSPGSDQTRRLLVPSVGDRILQTAAARALSHSFEDEFLESSFAYRPGRSVDRAIARICQWRDRGYCYVVDADIESFFDRVDCNALLAMLEQQQPSARLMGLLRQWVQARYWDGYRVRPLQAGVAQGSPLSPLLANFFLDSFDGELEKGGDHLVRYADDLVILCQSEESAQAALKTTAALLASQKLKLNAAKTRIANFESGFHFLGAYFFKKDVFIPWKRDHRKGKLLFMAPPMPRAMLLRYEGQEPKTTVALAFERGGLTLGLGPDHATPRPGRSSVAFLYLTEQGAVLRKSGDRLLVENEDRVELDLPYHKLESVLVFGNVQITTQAMAELLDKGIAVSLFSRQGRFRGSLDPPRGKNVLLRLAQFEAYKDRTRSLQFARSAVEAKIANGLAVLSRYADRQAQPGGYAALRDTIAKSLEASAAAQSLEALLGIEGAAAHAQFSALMLFNRSPFAWAGRVRHPATDPLNALLSLAYTLLTHELIGLLAGVGLDPYLGYLHQPDYGRPSLALDLLESFRHPVADRLVLAMVNRGDFEAGDFQPGGDREGVFLTPKAMRRFFAEYERRLLEHGEAPKPTRSFRDLLKREVEKFSAALREKQKWAPFRLAGC